MPPTQSSLDPVSVSVVLALTLFSPEIAAVVGPYAVILIAATCGAGWSLGRRDPMTRVQAARYFLKVVTTAALITVGAAKVLGSYIGANLEQWLLAPVALVLAAIGEDWQAIGRWSIQLLGKLLERLLEKRIDATERRNGEDQR